MASKLMMVFLMLFVLSLLAVRLEAGGGLPVIHFSDAVKGENPAPIDLRIRAGGFLRGSAQLKSGQRYEMRVKVDDVHFAMGVFGLRFTSFHAYEPARDKGQAAVYWRADNKGFSMSHDNINWKLAAPWESE